MGHLSFEQMSLCKHRSTSPKCAMLWQKPGHEQSTRCTWSWCQGIITEKGCDTGKALVPHLQLQLTWATRNNLALVAEPSQQLPSQGTGMRTKGQRHVPQCAAHPSTVSPLLGQVAQPTAPCQAPQSCWVFSIFLPSNLPCSSGNKHSLWQQPLPSTFQPVVSCDGLKQLEQ